MSGFDAVRAVSVLRTLASAPRLLILKRLLHAELSVAALETTLSLRQPGLSQHLAELRQAGLVQARREARSVSYRIADAEARRLVVAVLHGFGAVPEPEADTDPPVPRVSPAVGAARFAQVHPRSA